MHGLHPRLHSPARPDQVGGGDGGRSSRLHCHWGRGGGVSATVPPSEAPVHFGVVKWIWAYVYGFICAWAEYPQFRPPEPNTLGAKPFLERRGGGRGFESWRRQALFEGRHCVCPTPERGEGGQPRRQAPTGRLDLNPQYCQNAPLMTEAYCTGPTACLTYSG